MCSCRECSTSRALLVAGARQEGLNHFPAGNEGVPVAAIDAEPLPDIVRRGQERYFESFNGSNSREKGGESTRVMMAVFRPRPSTSLRPARKELNCPSSGLGLTARKAEVESTTGAIACHCARQSRSQGLSSRPGLRWPRREKTHCARVEELCQCPCVTNCPRRESGQRGRCNGHRTMI